MINSDASRSGALCSRLFIGLMIMIVLFIFYSCALLPFSKKSYLENYENAHNLMTQNRPAEAIPYYRKALNQNKHFDPIFQELAACYQQTGELDSAIIYYQGAITLNPKNIIAYRSIEEILMKQGNFGQAEIWHRDSIEIESDEPSPYSAPVRFSPDYNKEMNLDSLRRLPIDR